MSGEVVRKASVGSRGYVSAEVSHAGPGLCAHAPLDWGIRKWQQLPLGGLLGVRGHNLWLSCHGQYCVF